MHTCVMALWLALLACAFLFTGLPAWSIGVAHIAYDTLVLIVVFALTLDLRRARPQHAVETLPGESLGVIIAAYNEALVLPHTVDALVAQTSPPDSIVIADDGSDDGTAEMLAARYGLTRPAVGELSPASISHPKLRWLRLPHGGKARALNAALPVTDTTLVMTVDADTRLAPGAIAAMRLAFAGNPSLVAATGVLTPVCGPSLQGRVLEWFQHGDYISNFMSRHAWARINSLLTISGALAGFRRAALLRVGGFDTDCMVEDYELINRLHRFSGRHQLGWTTTVVGKARGVTSAPSEARALLRQGRRWFGGFLQTHYWYLDMCGNGRYGKLGLLMLPLKAVDTMHPIVGLSALALLAYFLAIGNFAVVLPAACVIGAKAVIDVAFHLWRMHLYRGWTGNRAETRPILTFVTMLAMPFTFKPLLQLSAAWGWIALLSGWRGWGSHAREDLRHQVAERA